MKYNGLDLLELVFDEKSVFNNVALVTMPAIEEGFIQLCKQDGEVQLKIDKEKRIVSGPVMIPEQPIYRDMNGKKFYFKCSKETIADMALNFFKAHRNTEGNLEHQLPVNGITYYESYLLNKERGINPVEFNTLPDGTWIMSAKVENDDVWALVRNGDLTGFSIDASNIRFKEEKAIDSLEELAEYLKNA